MVNTNELNEMRRNRRIAENARNVAASQRNSYRNSGPNRPGTMRPSGTSSQSSSNFRTGHSTPATRHAISRGGFLRGASLVAGSALAAGLGWGGVASAHPSTHPEVEPDGLGNYTVYPTGVYPDDRDHVQWAVDNVGPAQYDVDGNLTGPIVLLKAMNKAGTQYTAFNFGSEYFKPSDFDYSNPGMPQILYDKISVKLRKDIVVLGEFVNPFVPVGYKLATDNPNTLIDQTSKYTRFYLTGASDPNENLIPYIEADRTAVFGGFFPFSTASPAYEYMAGPIEIDIENLWIEEYQGAINFWYCKDPIIRNNVVKNFHSYRSAVPPGYNDGAGISFMSLDVFNAEVPITGGTSGNILIENNYVETKVTEFDQLFDVTDISLANTSGILVYSLSHPANPGVTLDSVQISGNVVTGEITQTGISLFETCAPSFVENNYVEILKPALEVYSVGNGIKNQLAGWPFNSELTAIATISFNKVYCNNPEADGILLRNFFGPIGISGLIQSNDVTLDETLDDINYGAISIYENWSNSEITGNTIHGSGFGGILFWRTFGSKTGINNNTVMGNDLSDYFASFCQVGLLSGDNNSFSHNKFGPADFTGILLYTAEYNTFTNNSYLGNYPGWLSGGPGCVYLDPRANKNLIYENNLPSNENFPGVPIVCQQIFGMQGNLIQYQYPDESNNQILGYNPGMCKNHPIPLKVMENMNNMIQNRLANKKLLQP